VKDLSVSLSLSLSLSVSLCLCLCLILSHSVSVSLCLSLSVSLSLSLSLLPSLFTLSDTELEGITSPTLLSGEVSTVCKMEFVKKVFVL
jgi:hypothetical protein